MFFYISKEQDDLKFNNRYWLGNGYWLHTDDNWQKTNSGFFKGYKAENFGNFVNISINDHLIQITHPEKRTCPLWINNDARGVIINNFLQLPNAERVPSDRFVTLHTVENKITYDYYDCYKNEYDEMLFSDAVNDIYCLIDQKFKYLANYVFKNGVVPKFFFSGGIDTLTCFSFIQKHDIGIELLTTEHFESGSTFDLNFRNRIKETHWAYNQIHVWPSPSVIITGGNGDEMFLRSPDTSTIWCLANFDSTTRALVSLEDYDCKYLMLQKYAYLDSPKDFEKFRNHPAKAEAHIINMCANDHQHWHYDNTITFTPLDDLRILKAILKIKEKDKVLRQILNGDIQRAIIARNNPELLDLLARQKNNNESCSEAKNKFMRYIKTVDFIRQIS